MTSQFIALDVETASNEKGAICQIGLAAFDEGSVVWHWSTLVNPEADFNDYNVRIHGIRSADVRTAPARPAVLAAIIPRMTGQIIASHTRFDYDMLYHATNRYGLILPDCAWLDTCAVARIAWPTLAEHDLRSLSQNFGIALEHHDATSDALPCGQLLNRAIEHTGLGIADWIGSVGAVSAPLSRGSRSRRYSERIEVEGAPGGPLAGHVWVCTGDFSVGEAALVELAASLGCDVKNSFTKKTTILVLGQRDPAQFGGKKKISKQLQAEAALQQGRKIIIMTEREFLKVAKHFTTANQRAAAAS